MTRHNRERNRVWARENQESMRPQHLRHDDYDRSERRGEYGFYESDRGYREPMYQQFRQNEYEMNRRNQGNYGRERDLEHGRNWGSDYEGLGGEWRENWRGRNEYGNESRQRDYGNENYEGRPEM